MGYFDSVKERLDKQFISVDDSITFIFHQDSCTYQDAFNLVSKKLIFDQTHLLMVDELKLKTILICREQDPNSHNAYITIEALITQLQQHRSDTTINNINKIGFGKKRFYEQLLNMGFIFDNSLLFEAQSPDIDYSDCETEAESFAYYNGLPKEYETLKRSYENLENQLKQSASAKDNLDIEKLRQEIADLKAENNKLRGHQATKSADDLKDVPHQSYRTLDRVMYAMAKITGLDNSKPYSQNNPSLNAEITTILQNDGLPLEYEAVGKWLSRINDIKPLK